VAAAVLVAVGCAACVHQREKPLAMVAEGSLARSLIPDSLAATSAGAPATGWEFAVDPHAPIGPAARVSLASAEGGVLPLDGPSSAAERSPLVADAAQPLSASDAGSLVAASDRTDATVRTSSAPPAHQPLADGMSIEQMMRETFLSCDTVLSAATATLFVPARYAPEVELSGISVVYTGPGRRTATAGTLRLRRLTIHARTLTLVVRGAGATAENDEDVSITARGDVSFEADRPASAITERHLRTLLVRNDGYTPLR
jgi:hypothetical protein